MASEAGKEHLAEGVVTDLGEPSVRRRCPSVKSQRADAQHVVFSSNLLKCKKKTKKNVGKGASSLWGKYKQPVEMLSTKFPYKIWIKKISAYYIKGICSP